MAGGSSDWETLLNHQKELLSEAKNSSKYAKIAVGASAVAAVAAIIAIFK